MQKSDKANVNALFEKHKKDNPAPSSNPISRWRQKQAIKKKYIASRAGKSGAKTAASKCAEKTAKAAKTLTEKAAEFVTVHSKAILLVLVFGVLFMVVAGFMSSCSAMFQGGTQIMIGTSYTADEEVITGANGDYGALEDTLRSQIANIERTHPGYDEYRYNLDEINHNPHGLTAYLTVLFEDYTRAEVQSTLQNLFNQQYTLTLNEVVEIRTRTETRTDTSTDPETGETTTDTWVINHCGNGWSYGRLTANSLKNICAIIPRSEAKPGDLIFFQGTYNTSGASHVGIYVGGGMMIHCGNPISYASIETSYWQQHFYCFGRIPN